MEKKSIDLTVKRLETDSRILTGYASAFGLPADSAGDVIVAGAFIESIAKIKNGGIPLLNSHRQTADAVLGTVIDAREDPTGLFITAQLADTPQVEEIRQKMMQGHITKMSIGFYVADQEFKDIKGETLRFIKKADLMEVSVVPIPANSRAAIVSVKSRDTAIEQSQKEVAKSSETKESTFFCNKQYLSLLSDMLRIRININKQGNDDGK